MIGHRGAPGYELPGDIVAGWGASKGAKDPGRDVIGDFQYSGFAYESDATELKSVASGADKLLGLFSFST